MTIQKIDGKLSKRETLRRMYQRYREGGAATYCVSYLARRLGLSESRTRHYVRWMNQRSMIRADVYGRQVIFGAGYFGSAI